MKSNFIPKAVLAQLIQLDSKRKDGIHRIAHVYSRDGMYLGWVDATHGTSFQEGRDVVWLFSMLSAKTKNHAMAGKNLWDLPFYENK